MSETLLAPDELLISGLDGSDTTESTRHLPRGALGPLWGDCTFSRAFMVVEAAERAEASAPYFPNRENSGPDRGRDENQTGEKMSAARYLVGEMKAANDQSFWLKLGIPPFG